MDTAPKVDTVIPVRERLMTAKNAKHLGLASSEKELNNIFSAEQHALQVYEYAITFPEQALAIIVRCVLLSNLDFDPLDEIMHCPELDLRLDQINLATHREAWMGALSLANPFDRYFILRVWTEDGVELKTYAAYVTLCSLLIHLPDQRICTRAKLHGSAYATLVEQGDTLLLPAPTGGFIDQVSNTPIATNGEGLKTVLLDILPSSQNQTESVAAASRPGTTLVALPGLGPASRLESRCEGVAVLHIYLSDDRKKVRLHESCEAIVKGYAYCGQLLADVQETVPDQLFDLIEKQYALDTITLYIYDTPAQRNSTDNHFLHRALPGWALPTAPLLFNWSCAPNATLNDWLPDTVGFEYSIRSTATNSWNSPCYLLADRSLAIGETVHVFAQDLRNGAVLKKVSLHATAQNYRIDQWPSELAARVNASTDESGVQLYIGRDAPGETNIAENTPDSSAFAAMGIMERTGVNRLWGLGSDVRITCTAPFMANLVCALPLPATDLQPGIRLNIQVRDATTQRLLENHIFTPDQTRLRVEQWQQAICHFLNTHSEWLKAGQLFGPFAWVVPCTRANSIWIPQESDLTVTIEPMHWQQYAPFSATQPFRDGQRFCVHAHDPSTGEPLPGSPLVFTPDAGTHAREVWPSALARALMDSQLSEYIRLGNNDQPGQGYLAEGATEGVWWTPGLPLRIWFDDPQGQVLDWQAATDADEQALLLAPFYQAPYGAVELMMKDRRTQMTWGYLTYTPDINGQATDKASWMRGLYRALRAQNQLNLVVATEKPTRNGWDDLSTDYDSWKIWIPRQADMEVTLCSLPTTPFLQVGQWPLLKLSGSYLKDGEEYFIHATDARTGEPKPGSPIKWTAAADKLWPTEWTCEFTVLLNQTDWGKAVRLECADPSQYRQFNFQSTSPDVLVRLDSRLTAYSWEELLMPNTDEATCIGDWYQTPSTAIALESQGRYLIYVPTTDGSVTDKRSWLIGLFNALRCQVLKHNLNHIAVCRERPCHALWDTTEPEACKIWIAPFSGRPRIEYLQRKDLPNLPTPIATPRFENLYQIRDRLIRQGAVLGRNLHKINDLLRAYGSRKRWPSEHLPDAIAALSEEVEALATIKREVIGWRSEGNYTYEARQLQFFESMIDPGYGSLAERFALLPKIFTDETLTRALDNLPATTLEAILHYRLTLDDGTQIDEPDRWLLCFDNTVSSLQPLQCTGRELSVRVFTEQADMIFRLQLLPDVFAAGVRLLSVHAEYAGQQALSIALHLPDLWPENRTSLLCPLALADFVTAQMPSQGAKQISILPPVRGKVFRPDDTLCADNSNTAQSELHDVTGVLDNGVDPQTGLFHAHYPVATLQGVKGLGPVVDLTIHYSALRANESALGDGWAFRFSSFDNRLRKLTLATGQVIQLTSAEVNKLCEEPERALDKGFCQLSHGLVDGKLDGDRTCLRSLKITYLSKREEILGKPIVHDNEEASPQYRETIKSRLNKVRANLNHWLSKTNITNAQSDSFKAARNRVEESLKEISRKAFIITTQTIKSPQGGTLELAWEGWKGHVRLLSVQSGDTPLLRANHEQPTASGSYRSTFHIWPDTAEAYEVTLHIEDCLLRTLTRRADEDSPPLQQVHYSYQHDHALDRVLCAIHEEDGSLEAVSYEPQIPRAKRDDDYHLNEMMGVERDDDYYLNEMMDVERDPDYYLVEMMGAQPEEDQGQNQSSDSDPNNGLLIKSVRFGDKLSAIPLPRVVRHTLVPGAGQATISHRWLWTEGKYVNNPDFSCFSSTESLEVSTPTGAPFTQRIWGTKDGLVLPLAVVEETPGAIRRTTTNTYPDSVKSADNRSRILLLSQPTATEVVYEDLSGPATQEPQA